MGDHRADIKIEMEFHGVKDKADMYVNYFADDDGMDSRVVEFFRSVYERGMRKYDEENAKRYDREHKKEIEEREKEELNRLTKKYSS